MKKYFYKIASFALLGMLMTGCEQNIALLTPEGTLVGSGTLHIIDNNTASAKLLINGISYQGTWTAQKVDESRTIASHYGFSSRKYQHYSTGNDSYLRQGEAVLFSAQGEKLTCEIHFRGADGRASCGSAAADYVFLIRS